MPDRRAKKLLIIGWDAADWMIIRALFAAGEMPNLQKLLSRGAGADLATLDPKLSPLLWTSIATGKTADKHGILHFLEPNPDSGSGGVEGVRISASTTRKTKALWNILTQSGMKVNVISWYASHPAEPINGCNISNLFQEGAPASSRDPWPLLDKAVHPAALATRIAKQRLHPAQVAQEMLRAMVPKIAKIDRNDERIKTLTRHIAQCHSVHRAAMAILADDKKAAAADCTMIFYDTIDTVGHHFMQFHPPRMAHVTERDFDLFKDVMNGVYRLHDHLLGELLRSVGPDTTVMLLSDHGFYSDELRPVEADLSKEQRAAIEASWHRPFGVLVMSGPGVKPGAAIITARLLDITPTALALLGLPVGQDMDGRVLVEAFDSPVQIATHPSWDTVEGNTGMHPPEMRLDPFEAQDAMQQLVDLGYMAAMPEDAKAKVDLVRRESQFNLAVVYMTTGRGAQAIPIYRDLTKQQPNEGRYVLGLAHCLLNSLQYPECATVLGDFLQLRPEHFEARLMLTAALDVLDRQAEALAQFVQLKRELEAQPGRHADRLQPMGDLCSSLRKWDEAERFYTQALAREPNNSHILNSLARIALVRERFEDSIDFSLRALEIQQVFPDAHYQLGVALAWVEDFDHAVQSFNVAVSMEPGLIDAHRFLAALYTRQGKTMEAAQHQDRVAKLLAGSAADGQTSFIPRESPMGPAEWTRRNAVASFAPSR